MSSSSSTAANAGAALPPQQSKLYKVLATPVILISFIISLAWVDFRYDVQRRHSHADTPSRMPVWLHRLLYHEHRGDPYEHIRAPASNLASPPPIQAEDGRWYFHSKQKKLARMEVAEAFEMRTTVLFVIGVLFAISAGIVWRLGTWAIVWLRHVTS